MHSSIANDIFLKACRRIPAPRTPIWIMRQAGRYLAEYRKIREKTGFLSMCKNPELAAQVTALPVEILGVDAAIIFSDIMVVPEAMGMKLQIVESRGPILESPIRSSQAIKRLAVPNPESELGFVMRAIELTKRDLAGKVPLIGFSGSPWTLFSYMVEGEGSRDFRKAKAFAYSSPMLAHGLLAKITSAVAGCLSAQIEAGADAVQIFDSWGGNLPASLYGEFSLNYIAKIIDILRKHDAPIIVFAKDCDHSLARIVNSGCDVVGLDWRTDIKAAKTVVGLRASIQGNLDPALLYAPIEKIKAGAREVLEGYGNGGGHIFNLGHGIPPDVPVENVKALVAFVKEESKRFH